MKCNYFQYCAHCVAQGIDGARGQEQHVKYCSAFQQMPRVKPGGTIIQPTITVCINGKQGWKLPDGWEPGFPLRQAGSWLAVPTALKPGDRFKSLELNPAAVVVISNLNEEFIHMPAAASVENTPLLLPLPPPLP